MRSGVWDHHNRPCRARNSERAVANRGPLECFRMTTWRNCLLILALGLKTHTCTWGGGYYIPHGSAIQSPPPTLNCHLTHPVTKLANVPLYLQRLFNTQWSHHIVMQDSLSKHVRTLQAVIVVSQSRLMTTICKCLFLSRKSNWHF